MTCLAHRAKWVLLLPVVLLMAGATPGVRVQTQLPQRPTAILAAMSVEADPIKERMTDKETQTLLGIRFISGRLEGRPVVLAVTGAGKVNAAMATALLLDHFQPAEVIFTGIAGGLNPDLQPGDVVIGSKLAQHDLGAIAPTGYQPSAVRNPATGKQNPLYFPCDANLAAIARRAAGQRALLTVDGSFRPAKVVDGVIVTGDVFVASAEKRSALHNDFQADAVEMEGAAVAQVCFQQQVPFLVLRALSDSADEKAYKDLKASLKVAIQNSVGLTIALVAQLQEDAAASAASAPAGLQ